MKTQRSTAQCVCALASWNIYGSMTVGLSRTHTHDFFKSPGRNKTSESCIERLIALRLAIASFFCDPCYMTTTGAKQLAFRIFKKNWHHVGPRGPHQTKREKIYIHTQNAAANIYLVFSSFSSLSLLLFRLTGILIPFGCRFTLAPTRPFSRLHIDPTMRLLIPSRPV